MDALLSAAEVRVLGSLIEKELNTPDNYPLSLAALEAACNQKSSREPVMEMTEAEVLDALNSLMKKHLVRERSGAGSRVTKYAHRLSGNLDPAHELTVAQRALLSLLMLRGPQTVGELRSRSARMHDFSDIEEVERTLLELETRPGRSYVAELPRRPGQRERRFMHVLSGGELPQESYVPSPPAEPDRLALLEAQVAALRDEVSELRAKMESLGGAP